MKTNYSTITDEVKQVIEEIEKNDVVFKKIEKYYKGVQILFSNLIHKPKIMLIGINPGDGYFKQKGERVKKFEPEKKLEYSYPYYKYPLALNTRKLYELAGCTEYLENSVKTNCFFLATNTEKELYQMLSYLKEYKLYKKSDIWINKLIEIIEPEIIICEGKSAFDRVIKNKDCEKIINKHYCYTKYKNIDIIGYRRIRSSIKHINEVANLLKEKVNK